MCLLNIRRELLKVHHCLCRCCRVSCRPCSVRGRKTPFTRSSTNSGKSRVLCSHCCIFDLNMRLIKRRRVSVKPQFLLKCCLVGRSSSPLPSQFNCWNASADFTLKPTFTSLLCWPICLHWVPFVFSRSACLGNRWQHSGYTLCAAGPVMTLKRTKKA